MILHEKHPILKKLAVNTLKTLLAESSVIYLSPNQNLYKSGASDPNVYIILFGKLSLMTAPKFPKSVTNESQINAESESSNNTDCVIGKVNIGWTLGEEILFDKNL